jgi:hypothetical protein
MRSTRRVGRHCAVAVSLIVFVQQPRHPQSPTMSSAPPPPPTNPEKQTEAPASSDAASGDAPAEMDTTPDQPAAPVDPWADIPEEVKALSTDEIITRIRLIENDIKVRKPTASPCGADFAQGHAIGDVEIAA